MIEKLRIAAPYGQHRVLSNSIRYSSIVAGMLESNTAQLVTSIDAGDGQTYKLIRGRDYFDKVMSNLVEYSKTNSKRITIKYIFTPDNCELNQIDKFCEEVKGRGLLDSYFQVSVDFKQEWLTEELLQASIYLYLNLRKIGVYHVYMDEHIWQRWTQSHRGTFESLPISHLNGDLLSYICNPNSQDPFYIYGAGQLTSMLLSKSNFLDRWEVLGILDDTPSLAGKKCFGFEIEHSDSLKDKDGLIFLSGIQGIVYMKETVLQLGLNRHAILENLIW
jgi:MoaA/NifB/PqqE/SkfB family radical SAM enzyme